MGGTGTRFRWSTKRARAEVWSWVCIWRFETLGVKLEESAWTWGKGVRRTYGRSRYLIMVLKLCASGPTRNAKQVDSRTPAAGTRRRDCERRFVFVVELLHYTLSWPLA